LLNERGTSLDHRLAISIAVLTVEPEGHYRVLVRSVEDELDGTKWKDRKRLARVSWFELPDAFEPAQGCLQISHRDVEMVAFQSPPPVRPVLGVRSSRLRLGFRRLNVDPRGRIPSKLYPTARAVSSGLPVGDDSILNRRAIIEGMMRQLITRLDEQLLAKLKKRAAAEGRSVNALVTEILASQVAGRSAKAELRLRGGEQIVRPPQPTRIPTRESLRRASRAWGGAVSKALMEERSAR